MSEIFTPCSSIVHERDCDPKIFSLLSEMVFERGTNEDWERLSGLHYKSVGSRACIAIYRVMLGDMLIGVCMMSPPRLLLKARHTVFPNITPLGKTGDTWETNVYRAKWVNENLILNSRTVVDTMFRSTGVAYRMLNLAVRCSGKKYGEIQSSMCKFSPFAQKAGFRFVKPERPRFFEPGMKLFKRFFTEHPGDIVSILEEFERMPNAHQESVLKEFRAFYFRHSAKEKTGSNSKVGMRKIDAMTPKLLFTNLQQLILGSPMYGVYKNPDWKRQIPETLPLLAFDEQPVTAPLVRGKPL